MKNLRLLPCLMTGLLACGFLLIGPANAEAQIWKNLGKKIEKKVENQASKRLEKKIDKAIDKSFDKAEEGLDDAAKSTTTAAKQSNKQIAPTFAFNLGITYEVLEENNKKDQVNMSLWFSDEPYIGMSTGAQEDMFMVMHDGQIITFMEKEKTYMVMGTGFLSQLSGAAQEAAARDNTSDGNFRMEKIGSERLLGYNCDIYRITNDESVSKVWMAPALGSMIEGLMEGFSSFLPNNQINMADLSKTNQGMMLKTETTDDKGKTIVMQATEIHKNGKKINTSAYKSVGF